MSEHDHTSNGNGSPRSRRELLGLAGLGAAGLVAGTALSKPAPAQAADGDALLMGRGNETPATTNLATSKTQLNTSGAIVNDGALKVVAPNADYGVIGSAKTVGAFGSAVVGVLGDGSVGGQFSGTDAAISLDPRTAVGPPGGTNFKGDIVVDSDGVLWLCVADGTPGTWIRVSHGGTRMLDSPQRAYDSRNTGGKFAANETRTIAISSASPAGVAAIPANAIGVVVNITVAATESVGNVVAWPTGTTKPITSNINWFAPNSVVGNGATIKLGTGGAIDVFARNPTHVIIDVTAYVL